MFRWAWSLPVAQGLRCAGPLWWAQPQVPAAVEWEGRVSLQPLRSGAGRDRQDRQAGEDLAARAGVVDRAVAAAGRAVAAPGPGLVGEHIVLSSRRHRHVVLAVGTDQVRTVVRVLKGHQAEPRRDVTLRRLLVARLPLRGSQYLRVLLRVRRILVVSVAKAAPVLLSPVKCRRRHSPLKPPLERTRAFLLQQDRRVRVRWQLGEHRPCRKVRQEARAPGALVYRCHKTRSQRPPKRLLGHRLVAVVILRNQGRYKSPRLHRLRP